MNRYVYIVEGEPYVGTVTDIAAAVEEAHYGGLDVPPYAWFVGSVAFFEDDYELERERLVIAHDYTADDIAHGHVSILGETAPYKIDLRA